MSEAVRSVEEPKAPGSAWRRLASSVSALLPRRAPSRTPRWGMAIDLDLCTGCGDCVTACREENGVAGPPDEDSWMLLLFAEAEQGGAEDRVPMPVPCLHCDEPPCVAECPTGASRRSVEGLVTLDEDLCTRCRACEEACPYERRRLTRRQGERGLVEKCTFCAHRIRRVQEEAGERGAAPTDEQLKALPACAEACSAGAIVFGDLADPGSAVARAQRGPRAHRLLEQLGTRPKVVHLARTRSPASG